MPVMNPTSTTTKKAAGPIISTATTRQQEQQQQPSTDLDNIQEDLYTLIKTANSKDNVNMAMINMIYETTDKAILLKVGEEIFETSTFLDQTTLHRLQNDLTRHILSKHNMTFVKYATVTLISKMTDTTVLEEAIFNFKTATQSHHGNNNDIEFVISIPEPEAEEVLLRAWITDDVVKGDDAEKEKKTESPSEEVGTAAGLALGSPTAASASLSPRLEPGTNSPTEEVGTEASLSTTAFPSF